MLILSVFVAESAWIYLVLRVLAGASIPGLVLSPITVLAPYGISALITTLLGLWGRPGSDGVSATAGSGATAGTLHAHRSSSIALLAAIASTAIYLLSGTVCLMGVLWWELYRDRMQPGFSMLGSMLQEIQSSSDTALAAVALVAVGIFLWWRGSYLVRQETASQGLVQRFIWGTAGLLVLLAMGGATPVGSDLVLGLTAIYLAFSLLAAATARLQMVQRERSSDAGVHWGWQSAATAGLLLVAGFGLSLLFLGQLGELARRIDGLLTGYLLPLLLQLLGWMAHLLGLDKPPTPIPATPGSGVNLPGERPPDTFSMPEWIREAGRALFNISLISVILYGIFNSIRHWHWGLRRGGRGGMARERVPWKLELKLRALLFSLLRRLLARWPSLVARLRWLGPEQEARTTREIYRRLLAWGAKRGYRREPWVTPREHEAELARRWPLLEEDFRLITESYVRVRYGSLSLAQADLRKAAEGWKRIERWVDSRQPSD